MIIRKKILENSVIFEFSGTLEHETISLFQKAIDSCLDEDYNSIGINFKNLEYINSLGIGYLVYALKKCNDKKIDLVIIEASDYIKKVFDILSISNLFIFLDSNDQFIKKYVN